MSVRHLMSSAAPAARAVFVVEATAGLESLQREMARVSQRDENYERENALFRLRFKSCGRGFLQMRSERGAVSSAHQVVPCAGLNRTVLGEWSGLCEVTDGLLGGSSSNLASSDYGSCPESSRRGRIA